MKIIDSTVQALIDGKQYGGVLLAQLHFDTSTIYRVTNAPQTIYWDEDGGGEEAYLGLGELASMSTLPETNELGAISIQLTLTGIPAANVTEAFSESFRGRPVYIWYGILDTDTYAIQGGQSGPILIFAGLMDNSTVEFGETCTINISATSRLADWERARGGRFSDGYQRRYVDPTDTGFKYIIALQNRTVTWGGKIIFNGVPRTYNSDQEQDAPATLPDR